MKALTVWQPWASLIAAGAKPYEFRSWKPPGRLIGQRIAIHAAARPVSGATVLFLLEGCKRWTPDPLCLHAEIAQPILEKALENPRSLPLAHVLCTAVLGEPKRGDHCAQEFGYRGEHGSDGEESFNWGWPLTAIELLEPPQPARGALGLWEWRP